MQYFLFSFFHVEKNKRGRKKVVGGKGGWSFSLVFLFSILVSKSHASRRSGKRVKPNEGGGNQWGFLRVWLNVWPSQSLQSGYHRVGVHMYLTESKRTRMISTTSTMANDAAKAFAVLAVLTLLGRPVVVNGLGSCKEAGLCCSGRDASCVVQKTPQNAIIEDLRDTPCYCDHACLKLNDCCPDYRQTCGGNPYLIAYESHLSLVAIVKYCNKKRKWHWCKVVLFFVQLETSNLLIRVGWLSRRRTWCGWEYHDGGRVLRQSVRDEKIIFLYVSVFPFMMSVWRSWNPIRPDRCVDRLTKHASLFLRSILRVLFHPAAVIDNILIEKIEIYWIKKRVICRHSRIGVRSFLSRQSGILDKFQSWPIYKELTFFSFCICRKRKMALYLGPKKQNYQVEREEKEGKNIKRLFRPITVKKKQEKLCRPLFQFSRV